MLIGIFLLLSGIYLGLIRAGYKFPGISISFNHSVIMIFGFLGTLISLERAVAIKKGWIYLSPVLFSLGSILSLFQRELLLIGVLASFILAFAFFYLIKIYGFRFQWFVMALGAILLGMGGILYVLGFNINFVLGFWFSSLILTIGAERWELSVMFVKRKGRNFTFFVIVLFMCLVSATPYDILKGISFLLMALWLLYYDVAVFNIKGRGLVRFVAINLLAGYIWLLVGGLGWMFSLPYDLKIHSITLGFVFGMIFAHAPIIFPSIMGKKSSYSSMLYIPFLLLHLSLIIRSFADIKLGSLLNAISIILYLAILRFKVIV